MYVERVENIEEKDLHNGEEIIKTLKKVLISEKEGAPNFRLRHFTIKPGGHTPWHSHDWEHENYFLRGEGVLVTEKGETEISPDCFAFVAPGEQHQYKNTGNEPLEMLCLVPITEDNPE